MIPTDFHGVIREHESLRGTPFVHHRKEDCRSATHTPHLSSLRREQARVERGFQDTDSGDSPHPREELKGFLQPALSPLITHAHSCHFC